MLQDTPSLSSAFAPRPGETTLSPYIRAIRSHLLVALLVVLACVGGAIAWLTVRSPNYEADAQIVVTPIPRDDPTLLSLPVIRDTGDPTRTIQTAAALVDTHEAAVRTARKMGAEWTVERVEKHVKVEPQGQTDIVGITAKAHGADEAARLANTFTRNALDVRRARLAELAGPALADVQARLRQLDPQSQGAADLERARTQLQSLQSGTDPTLSISQLAVPPEEAIGVGAPIVVLLSLIAGLVLAAATALLLELVGPDRIGSEEELTRVFPLPVLTRVPRVARSRRRPSAGTLEVDPLIRESYRTLLLQIELSGKGKQAIMIASASRGDGKTSAAANFAIELASRDNLVILIDGDLRKPDLANALMLNGPGAVAADEDREQLDVDTEDPLKPVPGQPTMWLLDLSDLMRQRGIEGYMQRAPGLITGLLSAVDYVVVDTPPIGEVSDALVLINEIDHVVMVSRLRNTRRRSLEVARDLLTRSGKLPLGYIVVGAGSTSGRYPYGGA